MIPARTPGAMLAEVHRRARRYRRRQAITAAAVLGTVALLAVVVIRLATSGDGNNEEGTGGTTAPPDLTVDLNDAADSGLPGGFVPKGLAAGPNGFVLTGDAPGGGMPVWRSDDGRAWTVGPEVTFANTSAASLAATSNRYLIGVTDTAGGSPRFLFSDDGEAWELASQPGANEDLASLRAAGHRFYRASGGGIITSVDGVGWEATVADTGPLPAGTVIDTVGSSWIALALGPTGQITAAWRSTDGLAFTPITAPDLAPAGVVGGSDHVVIAVTGGACTPATTAAPPEATAASTTAPSTTAAAPCDYSIGFARLDPGSGVAERNNQVAFTSADAAVRLGRIGDGWLALQHSPDGLVVWASGDGLTWARASDDALGVADGGPVVLAAGSDETLVVSDSPGTEQPPGIAVISES